MFKTENICKRISSIIAKELNLNKEKESVINYGIFALIQMGICILLIIIFGFIFNVVTEALIISFTVSILRKSSGGSHASSPEKCAIIGTVFSIGMGMISKFLSLDFNCLIVLGVCVFAWAYYFVNKLAPVDSIAKPINNIERRKKLKKTSVLILSIYLIVIIMNFIYFHFIKNEDTLVYILCIYMGILWQVSSLTKSGHLLLGKLDELF